MEILLIILFAPLALAAGFGIVRLLMEPITWFVLVGLAGVIALIL